MLKYTRTKYTNLMPLKISNSFNYISFFQTKWNLKNLTSFSLWGFIRNLTFDASSAIEDPRCRFATWSSDIARRIPSMMLVTMFLRIENNMIIFILLLQQWVMHQAIKMNCKILMHTGNSNNCWASRGALEHRLHKVN